jgi:hypothetical protein
MLKDKAEIMVNEDNLKLFSSNFQFFLNKNKCIIMENLFTSQNNYFKKVF